MTKQSKTSSSPTMPLLSVFILALILLLAIDALHLQLSRISYNDLVAPLLDPDDTRLRKTYTGIGPIDGFLTVVLTMFMPVFTGEMPELSLFTANFAGQVPAQVAMMVVEGMREGKARGLTFAGTWMILMQVGGFGVVMPAYYILDLVFSSYKSPDLTVRDASKLDSKVYLPAITLGYILPSALQLVPVSEDLHQIFLAAWQPFPIYVVGSFWLFSQASPSPPLSVKAKAKSDIKGIHRIYSFAITVGAVTHWATILLVFFRSSIFDAAIAEQLSFINVFVPHPVRWYGPSTIAQASMQFLQWDLYCGGTAGLVWAATLAHHAGAWKLGMTGVAELFKDVLLMGMPSAVLSVLRKRDMAVVN